jgi:hypothetical protein
MGSALLVAAILPLQFEFSVSMTINLVTSLPEVGQVLNSWKAKLFLA